MPITLITGPANAGKARVVMDAVRRQLARSSEPLLVVPTRADREHYLRELAADDALAGARVERFAGLVSEAVRRAGIATPALASRAREQLLARLARELSGAPPSAGLLRALAELLAELETRRVAPARLQSALRAWAQREPRAAVPLELGRLYAAYRRTLEQIGRLDPERRAVLALDALRRDPSLWGSTPVLFYGFDDLTPLQLDAIETLGVLVRAEVTVALAYEPGRAAFAGRAATFQTLLPLAAEHRALPARAEHYAPRSRAALAHLERSLFEPDAARVDPGGAVALLEGASRRAELELAAQQIAQLLERGLAPHEIALVTRTSPAGAEELEEILGAARVPFALERRRPFADTAIGAGLLGLLRCAGPDGELRDLLAWLRTPGLLKRPELADKLELRARRSGAASAAQARALWEQQHWPLDAIEQLRDTQQRGPVPLIERASRELLRLFSAPLKRAARVLDARELQEGRALAEGRRALGELCELAKLDRALAPGDPAALADALARVEVLVGEPPGPGAIAVLDPLALRARRVRALFVCGLQEGTFPARTRAPELLGAAERRRLAELSGLVLAPAQETLAAERYLFYATVSRPEELLFLGSHAADDDGEPASRSLFVDDVLDLFDPRPTPLRRALGAPLPPAGARAHAQTAFPPLRDESLLAQLRERVWSASSLELWIRCPVRWFVERLLAPRPLEPDAEPLARGGLAHAALKDVLEGLREAHGSARLHPARAAEARALLDAALRRREPEFPLSLVPERSAGIRRRLQADLERYLERACESASQLEPSALELGFGFDAEDPRREDSTLPAAELAPGLSLRGRIDRLDEGAGREAVVYDYKGREVPGAARWGTDGNLQVGLYMLAAEQLLGVRAAGGFYQPLAGRDLRARGVLDAESSVELECVRGELLPREEVRVLLERVRAAARSAAGEAAHGALEPRPRTCSYQGGCSYPTICRCER